MKLADVRARAFAMPLNAPSYPPGPYRYYDREHLVIAYRTDPERPAGRRSRAARRDRRPRRIRIHPTRRIRPGSAPTPDVVRGSRSCFAASAESSSTRCISTMARRSRAGAKSGAFRKSWRSPQLYTESEVLVGTLALGVACSARSAPWATSTRCLAPEPIVARSGAAISSSRSSPMSTARPRICELVRYRYQDVTLTRRVERSRRASALRSCDRERDPPARARGARRARISSPT